MYKAAVKALFQALTWPGAVVDRDKVAKRPWAVLGWTVATDGRGLLALARAGGGAEPPEGMGEVLMGYVGTPTTGVVWSGSIDLAAAREWAGKSRRRTSIRALAEAERCGSDRDRKAAAARRGRVGTVVIDREYWARTLPHLPGDRAVLTVTGMSCRQVEEAWGRNRWRVGLVRMAPLPFPMVHLAGDGWRLLVGAKQEDRLCEGSGPCKGNKWRRPPLRKDIPSFPPEGLP